MQKVRRFTATLCFFFLFLTWTQDNMNLYLQPLLQDVRSHFLFLSQVDILLQMPTFKEHGLELVDPSEELKVKDKSLRDMGKDNYDLSAFLSPISCVFEEFVTHVADAILLDIEGSPFLAIKDVKHAAAAREASSKSEGYSSSHSCAFSLLLRSVTQTFGTQVHQRTGMQRGRAAPPHSERLHSAGNAWASYGCRHGHGRRRAPTALG